MISLTCLSACGGRKPPESEQHDLYRRIQEGETASDEARHHGAVYVSPLETAEVICKASRDVCKAAKRSKEADAKERCARAQASCDAALSYATGGP